MGCSGSGLVAIVVLFVAVVLSVVSIVLPAWSTSTVSTKTGTAEFGAGVWGYCTDLGVDTSGNATLAPISFDHCYFFHTTNKFEVPDAVDNAAFMANFSSRSLLSIVAGVFAFLTLLLGVTCCKNKSVLIGAGKVLSGAAFALTLLAFLLWLAQAHPLTKKDDVNYSGSFILSVLAALLYLIVTTLAARHAALA
ncbi:hypothetical protein PybrP1_001041 [[Pythium] brassicae (nom. inval.)]|nr:hypothetical protein PybrP1_001041 [[Pythium] brassicae (nom. inval.)]